jgi:pimeloyl-ACP methyl ester carboxylesterase
MLTRYVKSFDGASLAVQFLGEESDLPLVCVTPWATAALRDDYSVYDSLATARRVITYDRRGTGASSRDVTDLSLDAQVADVAAVADAYLSTSFDILAHYDGTPIAIAFAARFPDRVIKLVLWHPFADGADYVPPERVRSLITLARSDWDLALHTLSTIWLPRGSTESRRRFARTNRERLTRGGVHPLPGVGTGHERRG